MGRTQNGQVVAIELDQIISWRLHYLLQESILNAIFKLSKQLSVPALRVGKVGSRLGPQDLEGPQIPKVGPQTYWQTCLIVMNIGGAPQQQAGQSNRHESLT